MPAINPNDYNIDKINTGFLGPKLTTDFRDWVLAHNLQDINPQLIKYGYDLSDYKDYAGDVISNSSDEHVNDLPDLLTESNTVNSLTSSQTPFNFNQSKNLWGYSTPYSYQVGSNTILSTPSSGKESYIVKSEKKLTDPGNVKTFINPNGTVTTSNDILEKIMKWSKYGPEFFVDKTSPDIPQVSTGFNQYKTTVGGDFRSTILGQRLGFSYNSGIDYDSELSDVGKEQRKFNVKERIKLNFIGDTLGKINVDPLGLLAGQDLFLRDYSITKPKSGLGKAAEFTASLAGFNLPTSIIPTEAGINREGFTDTLLKYTGEGTKSLLYSAIEQNKWGPKFDGGEKSTGIKGFIKKITQDTPPTTMGYMDDVITVPSVGEDSLVSKLNQGVKKLVDGLMGGQEPPTIPTQSEKPLINEDPTQGSKNLGFEYEFFDETYSDEQDTQDEFNTKPKGGSKQYSNRFKSGKYNEGSITPELNSDKNNLFWASGQQQTKRGLLAYTQKLIDGGINNDFSSTRYIGIVNDKSNYTTGSTKHTKFSQGNRIKTSDNKTYCRSWSTTNTYSTYLDTIRNDKLRREDVFSKLSVLEDNGMPKIVPYPTEYENWRKSLHSTGEPSKYMLSIENLAWQNTREFNALPNVEKGPHGGRLMWFPPYNIDFTDNSSVNWESTQFIGRGEPIYTYNSTERTGTLSFTIITDHSSQLNILRDETEGNLLRYLAGCTKQDLDNSLFKGLVDDLIFDASIVKPKKIEPPSDTDIKLEFFFSNAYKDTPPGRDVSYDITQGYCDGTTPCQGSSQNLNENFQTQLNKMVDFLLSQQGKRFRVVSKGYTSELNVTDYNEKLGKDRATSLKNYLTNVLKEAEAGVKVDWIQETDGQKKTFPTESEWETDSLRWSAPTTFAGEEGGQDKLTGTETKEQIEKIVNDPKAVINRKAVITFEYNPDTDEFMLNKNLNESEVLYKKLQSDEKRAKETQESLAQTAKRLARLLVNEATYFNKIQVEDSFVFDSLGDKLQNFHPAFHSMTPEGMNSRLTFLQQCTRQGPSIGADKGEPQNMAFGKPPICVLRIGDFYHTKIVIDSISTSYEPLQWDLNPEGIGVQPMLAKVDLNFKFIGGSSLGGPIKQLQNAVSFNFFANTSVYNRRTQVTVNSDKNLPGRNTKKETFFYGSFITPSQETSNENIGHKEINLDTGDIVESDELVPMVQTEPKKNTKMSDDEKKVIEKNNNDDGVVNNSGHYFLKNDYKLFDTGKPLSVTKGTKVYHDYENSDNIITIGKSYIATPSFPDNTVVKYNKLTYDCGGIGKFYYDDGLNLYSAPFNFDLADEIDPVFCKDKKVIPFNELISK